MQNTLLSRRRLLAGLCTWPVGSMAAPRTAPLLLAQDAPADIDPAGYLVSEKYDGVRAWWDGSDLRFRSGLPIAAPAWFVSHLPKGPLDGELWAGRGRFEALSGAVRRHEPRDAEWRQIRYMLFELPGAPGPFSLRVDRLRAVVREQRHPSLMVAEQALLPNPAALHRRLHEVVAAGGEGMVLHRADAPYVTGRSPLLLKLKLLADAEAVVIGPVPGRGKHQGRMGALQVRTADGVAFFIGTGFSDAVRERPPVPGTWITYTHRGHTESGVPRFASYLRVRSA